MQSLPDWLKKKMQEMDSLPAELGGYAVFRGNYKWMYNPIYYIYSPLSSCIACEMYDERGELFEYGEDAEQKVNRVRLWRCIYSTK
jgi:hypothetical protein